MGKIGQAYLIRPIVMVEGVGLVTLEYYKSESGGNQKSGYLKGWTRAVRTPPTPAGELTRIGSQKWEIGENIEFNRFWEELFWQSPLITGVQASGSSQMDGTVILNVSVLGKTEQVLGICGTMYMSRSGTTQQTVKDPVWLDPDWSVSALTTIAMSGSFSGTAYAFLFHWTWNTNITSTHASGQGTVSDVRSLTLRGVKA